MIPKKRNDPGVILSDINRHTSRLTSEDFINNLLPLKNKMFRLAYRLLSNRQEAEDVVQETYLKTWNMRNDLEKYRNVEGLLMTMTRNLCMDILKS